MVPVAAISALARYGILKGMQLSSELHSFLPMFDWNWWQLLLFAFAIDWFALMVIAYFEPLGIGKPFGKGKRQHWKTQVYGDLFLPLGVASSIVVAQGMHATSAWYTSIWWNIAVIALGFAIVVIMQARSGHTRQQATSLFQLWHTYVAFPILFYLAAITVVPMFIVHSPILIFCAALLGYTGWEAMIVWDTIRPPDITLTA